MRIVAGSRVNSNFLKILITDAKAHEIAVPENNITVNSDATEVIIKINSDELKNTEGELQLSAFIGNIHIQASEKIKFVDKVQLGSQAQLVSLLFFDVHKIVDSSG